VGRSAFVTVIVSARALLREGLWRILGAADFEITAAASSLDEAMGSLSTEDRLILLIVDVNSGQPDIIGQIRSFKQQHPTARIALLAEQDQLSPTTVVAAFRGGADAYFLKPNPETLLKSLELVMLGETILPPEALSLFLDRYDRSVESEGAARGEQPAEAEMPGGGSPRLSAREQCILRDLIEGYSNKMIARRNDIAEATVKVHVKAILRKIRVNNRTQAAIWGMNHRSFAGLSSERTVPPSMPPLANIAKRLEGKDHSARA